MRTLSSIALVAAAAGASWLAWSARPHVALRATSSLPSVSLLFARPFQLERPATHVWRAEQPSYDSGWLLVVQTDGSFCEPRQIENVLYAGDTTLERVNHGFPSGRIVAILPAPRGEAEPDLRATPMWWGATGLPEQIDAADVALAREQALNAGLAPRPADEIARARRAGGDPLVAHDEGELRRVAAELMLTWSPGEEEEARSMLAPLLR